MSGPLVLLGGHPLVGRLERWSPRRRKALDRTPPTGRLTVEPLVTGHRGFGVFGVPSDSRQIPFSSALLRTDRGLAEDVVAAHLLFLMTMNMLILMFMMMLLPVLALLLIPLP